MNKTAWNYISAKFALYVHWRSWNWQSWRSTAITLVCVLVLCATPAWGQRFETDKLVASDGNAGGGECFGNSLAVSGNVAVVGAFGDKDQGYVAGAAYIFRYDPVSMTWMDEDKLLAHDGDEYSYLGLSVAISQVWAVAGALGSGVAGSAYVFRDYGIWWDEEAKLQPNDGDYYDDFGCSVAITTTSWDRYVLVGSEGDDDNGDGSGSAYVFQHHDLGPPWVQSAKLRADDGQAGDSFGCAVAVTGGNLALIGAMRDDDLGSNSGSAYIFRRIPNTETWTLEDKLLASDGDDSDFFGCAVSISGNLALVGASGVDYEKGIAYVFRYDSGSGKWYEEAKLVNSTGGSFRMFGHSVSISGETALIGEPQGTYPGQGYTPCRAILFRYDSAAGTWTEKAQLMASDATTGDLFGSSVSISGDIAMVGARGDNHPGVNLGSAYVYDVAFFGLSSHPDPLIAGQGATFTAYEGEAYTDTWLAYSATGVGSTPYPPLNIVLGLDRPKQVPGTSKVLTNAQGTAEWSILVPSSVAGVDVWFQAAQEGNVTNLVATTVQ